MQPIAMSSVVNSEHGMKRCKITTYLIDTDWVVHYFKGRQEIVKRLNALEDGRITNR